MEVLNQNQRRSALWRLFALLFFIFCLLAVMLFSTYQAFSQNGNEDYLKLQQEYQEAEDNWIAIESDLKTQVAQWREKYEECEKSKGDPNEEIQILKARLEAKDDRIDELTQDLTLCNQKLAACGCE